MGIKGKKIQKISQENEKTTCDKTPSKGKQLSSPSCKLLGIILKMDKRKLKQMNQRSRKLMTMHKVFHLRDGIDMLFVSRKEGGRGVASIKYNVDHIYPTPPLGQDMTQGQFLSEV